jgi:hypothetical protein
MGPFFDRIAYSSGAQLREALAHPGLVVRPLITLTLYRPGGDGQWGATVEIPDPDGDGDRIGHGSAHGRNTWAGCHAATLAALAAVGIDAAARAPWREGDGCTYLEMVHTAAAQLAAGDTIHRLP